MNLNEIKDPKFLKNLDDKAIYEVCDDIRNEIIRVTQKNGGHLSSNLGTVELTVALHKHYDFSVDKLFLDVGHQCYTHKILTGRSLENLRKQDGISGFPKLNESIYDHFEGGHSSNSLSNALGYAVARDLNGENYKIVCVIGDASISNGLAFEALNDIKIQDNKMIIILNDNGMSISQNVGNVSKLFSKISTSGLYNKSKSIFRKASAKTKFGKKFFGALFLIKNAIKRFLVRGNFFIDLGFNYIGVIDGHDINKLEKAFKKADKAVKTTVIHVKTVKGLGYKEAENDKEGIYHGVSAKYNENKAKNLNWSECYSKLFEEIYHKDKKSVLISPATLVGSKFYKLYSENNERIYDVGIAEEHAISFAAGLSLNGYHPYVSIYSTFLQRAFDELSHDIARMKIGATILIDRSGLAESDGDTHQGIFDEAYLLNTPNTVVCMASNFTEAARLMQLSEENKELMCIRYSKGTVPDTKFINSDNFNKYDWPKIINNNNKKCIISFGPVINEIYSKINENNLEYDLYNAIFQNPLNNSAVEDILENYDEVIIFNQYATKNGFNNALIDKLIERGYKGNIISKALKVSFGRTQTIKEGLKEQRMDVDSFFEDLE